MKERKIKQPARQQSQQPGQSGQRQQGGQHGEARQQSQQADRQGYDRSHWEKGKSGRGQQQ